MKKYRLILFALLGLLAVGCYLFIRQAGPQVTVRTNLAYKETVYSLHGTDQKEVSFTTYQTELNEMVLRWRSNSTLPLEEQIKLAAILLDRIKRDQPLDKFKTLSIGRLVEAFGGDDTFSRRLTSVARITSPIPFARQNNAVRDIANHYSIYGELKGLFAPHGLTVKAAAVEKVLVNKDNVPYDGIFWFALGKMIAPL